MPSGSKWQALQLLTRVADPMTRTRFTPPNAPSQAGGMTREESRPILDFLYEHSTNPDNIYRHMWQEGDVVMWDNRCTMHYAVHDYGEAERILNRVTMAGEVPA